MRIRLSKNTLRDENVNIANWTKNPDGTFGIPENIKTDYKQKIWILFCEYARDIGFSLYDTKNNVINQYTQELLTDPMISDEILKKFEEILSRNLGEIKE